jgi:putative radical SAM enzyme (TIGR03279 family)
LEKDDFGPGIVSSVEPGSPAEKAGILAGDMIWWIDGEPMRDLIDFYLLTADDIPHKFELERGKERLHITVEPRLQGPGLVMSDTIFGRITTCNNKCIFCFVDQLPAGLKPAVYVKDDDYRLSFLQGNFITLTNLEDDHVERILADRLSPLYVSLHTTNSHIRRQIFGNPDADRALERLRELIDGGIDVHIQIVLMRGINDDENLDRTLADLSIDYAAVASIGVVPVGISSGGAKTIPTDWGFDYGSAVELLELLASWSESLQEVGPFAADEFFYLAGQKPPRSAYYYDFPQLENGIGLTRRFRDELYLASDKMPQGGLEHTAIVTTPMGAWALDGMGLEDSGLRIISCENSLFGEMVNVCGLLPGRDIARALSAQPDIRSALVPGVAVDANGAFIDGTTVAQVAQETSVELRVVPCRGETLISALLELVDTGGLP